MAVDCLHRPRVRALPLHQLPRFRQSARLRAVLHDRFFKTPKWPWVGIFKVWYWQWGDARRLHVNGTQEFFFILLTLACTIWCWRALRASYAVWMALNWLLFTSTSFVISVPRYALTMFPIFILFARFTDARLFWSGIITFWSLTFMALFITLFVQGEWAF